MLKLSSASLNKSPSQSDEETSTTPATVPAEDAGRIRGVHVKLLGTKNSQLTVIIGPRAQLLAALVPVVYIFAGETFNQWFYLLLGGIMAALFLGFFLPMFQVLCIQPVCTLPENAVHNDTILIKINLMRRAILGPISKYIPVKWLLIRSNLLSHLGRESLVRAMVVEDVINESYVFATTTPLQRGIYKFESLELLSSFPFGLFWWIRKIESVTNTVDAMGQATKPLITIYPRLELVEGNFLYKIRASTDSPMGLMSSKILTNAASSSVRSLREFVHGDSPRLIHWPSSAKTGRLLVREFEAEGLPGFDLMLNLSTPWRTPDQFELAVSVVFSLLHLGYKLGGAPDLFLVPNLDIEPMNVPGFMTDMPALPSGLARSSHLLARIMSMSDRDSPFQVVDLKQSSRMALMTVRPVKQFIAASQNADDESLMYDVELAVIPRSADMGSSKQPSPEVHMPVHEFGISNRRVGGGPTGRVIATIKQYEEIARL